MIFNGKQYAIVIHKFSIDDLCEHCSLKYEPCYTPSDRYDMRTPICIEIEDKNTRTRILNESVTLLEIK